MKKLVLVLACAILSLVGVNADEVTVKASVTGKNNSQTKNDCRKLAKKLAVQKFLNRLDANMQESLVAKAVASYTKWTDDISGDDWEWEDGELSCEFSVTVDNEKLLQFLSENGWSVDKGSPNDENAVKFEVVIAEEKPGDGMMAVAEQMGVGTGGKVEFFKGYETYQMRVRDELVKQVNKIGINVPLLENNEAYADLKKSDPHLLGGTFNVNTLGWQYTDNFVETIRDNNPDTILLYYRIDTIAYVASTRTIRVSVSLNIKSLGGENGIVTKSLGAQDYVQKATGDQLDTLMADMAVAVTRATGMLMSGEGMNKKIVQFAKELRAQADAPKGPMTLVVNGSKVDKKIRDDFLLDLEDGLVKAGLCKQKDVKSRGNTVSCVITSTDPKLKDSRRLWRAIKKVLTEAGLDDDMVTDDIKTVNGKTMTVTPGK